MYFFKLLFSALTFLAVYSAAPSIRMMGIGVAESSNVLATVKRADRATFPVS
jgi:hypothetical protein